MARPRPRANVIDLTGGSDNEPDLSTVLKLSTRSNPSVTASSKSPTSSKSKHSTYQSPYNRINSELLPAPGNTTPLGTRSNPVTLGVPKEQQSKGYVPVPNGTPHNNDDAAIADNPAVKRRKVEAVKSRKSETAVKSRKSESSVSVNNGLQRRTAENGTEPKKNSGPFKDIIKTVRQIQSGEIKVKKAPESDTEPDINSGPFDDILKSFQRLQNGEIPPRRSSKGKARHPKPSKTAKKDEVREPNLQLGQKDVGPGLGHLRPGSSQPQNASVSRPPPEKTSAVSRFIEINSSDEETETNSPRARQALEAFKPRSRPLKKTPKNIQQESAALPQPPHSASASSLAKTPGMLTLSLETPRPLSIPASTPEISQPATATSGAEKPPELPVRGQGGRFLPRASWPFHDPSDSSQPSAESAPQSQSTPTEIEFNDDTDVSPPPIPQRAAPSPGQMEPRSLARTGEPWTEEEFYLIIYLKEVLALPWKGLAHYFPHRTWTSVQSQYSTKVNKRDRSKDPPNLLQAIYSIDGVVKPVPVTKSRSSPKTVVTPVTRTSQTVDYPPQSCVIPSQGVQQVQQRPNRERPSIVHSQELTPELKSRPRRGVAPVNYTWPKRNRGTVLPGEENETFAFDALERGRRLPSRSMEASEEPAQIPETAFPVDKPLNPSTEHEDAAIAMVASQPRQLPCSGPLPYLEYTQRQMLRNGPEKGEWDVWLGRAWQGTVVHVDFHEEEMELIERIAIKLLGLNSPQWSRNVRKRIRRLIEDQPAPKILQLSYEILRHMKSRDRSSIEAFLRDVVTKQDSASSHVLRIGAVRKSRELSGNPRPSAASMIRQREMGLQSSSRGWRATSQTLSYQLKNNVFDTMGPALSYTGASGDVHTVAWSPDGECFAAGGVCVTDPDSMQYNRSNNLLYGDITHKVIHELGEHYEARSDHRPETGVNSTHAMDVTQDPKLWTTVSMVAFSPDGQYMFSGGYDKHATIWQTRSDGGQPYYVRKLLHKAPVDVLAVSCQGMVATAAKKETARAIKLMTVNGPDEITATSFTSTKATGRPDLNILPTALKFEPNVGRVLLAGFGANTREDRLDTSGDMCLWDVLTQQQLHVHGSSINVFDVAFNPRQRLAPFFAAGCVAGAYANKGTKSVVRLYDPRDPGKYGMVIELECAALDMNDVLYCPYDDVLLAAGCTNGTTHVWDIRNPSGEMYKLAHGQSLQPLPENESRERTDTGIRFCAWGDNATRLYTGSSDGVVKVWNVAHSTDDVFIKDVATFDSGVMSGAFSPDKSRLLIGEVNGSVNLLEVGRDGCTTKDAEKFQFIPYDLGDDEAESQETLQNHDAESGVAISRDMLASGQMKIIPMGGYPIRQAVQGPNYTGPFDKANDASELRTAARSFQSSISVSSTSPQCSIPACQNISTVLPATAEEIGDSGRSKDRIPDEMMKIWTTTPNAANNHIFHPVPGKSKCRSCNLPARPKTPEDINPQCEFCRFSCFRCGSRVSIKLGQTSFLSCANCKGLWEIGALGYDIVRPVAQKSAWKTDSRNVPTLKGWARDLELLKMEDWDAGFGGNAVGEFYFGWTGSKMDG